MASTLFNRFQLTRPIDHFISKGVGPTAQRAAVITAVELPIYDICKHRLIQGNLIGDTVSNHFV